LIRTKGLYVLHLIHFSVINMETNLFLLSGGLR
jgi:hypothetical protein